MGGEVGVTSRPGEGSCFWFTARVGRIGDTAAAPPGDAARGTDSADAAYAAVRGARILLVEDNTFNQQIALEMLQEAGAHVTVAANGAEALDQLRSASFDAVLMDVQMPVMDGLEATRILRQDALMYSQHHPQGLRIIAMTANATSADRAACMDAGMDDFLAKPIQPPMLFKTLARWLPERAAPVPAPPLPPGPGFRPLAGDPAIIDLTILAKLLSYNQEKVRRFAFKFLQSTQDGLEEMERELKAGNIMRLRDLGHRIKSSARTVGALGMADLCQRLEHLPEGDVRAERAAAASLLSQLWELLHKVTEQVMQNTTFANDA
jgi:CheY-like chemotaxis protein/HPt (histidine-containing phosphotransfer) domain-containing protein